MAELPLLVAPQPWPAIRLSQDQFDLAEFVGSRRQDRALRDKLGHINNAPESGALAGHKWGACGELSVSELTGLKWNMGIAGTRAELTRPDVGPYEVRTNASFATTGRTDLCIRPRDLEKASWRVFISVLAQPDRWFLATGWIYGHEAEALGRWFFSNGRPGCWFVPREAQHDLAELPEREELWRVEHERGTG